MLFIKYTVKTFFAWLISVFIISNRICLEEGQQNIRLKIGVVEIFNFFGGDNLPQIMDIHVIPRSALQLSKFLRRFSSDRQTDNRYQTFLNHKLYSWFLALDSRRISCVKKMFLRIELKLLLGTSHQISRLFLALFLNHKLCSWFFAFTWA